MSVVYDGQFLPGALAHAVRTAANASAPHVSRRGLPSDDGFEQLHSDRDAGSGLGDGWQPIGDLVARTTGDEVGVFAQLRMDQVRAT
ncbi:MAG: hypothetical protein K2Q25_11305 [Mycobacteriaceae bacterium]|nr:hypothetical protein [Mycobacteriaceae bacterium]